MRRSRKYPIRFGIENLSFVLNGFIEVLLPLLYADKSCGSRRLEKLRQRVYSFGFVRAGRSDLYPLSLPKAPAALNADTMTDDQLHAALQVGIKEIQNGDTVDAASAFAQFREQHR